MGGRAARQRGGTAERDVPDNRRGRVRRVAVALSVAAFIAAGAPARAQTPPAPGLTLTQAIERALAANPTIGAARLQRPVDVAGIGVARERPNPEFAYEASKETPRQAFGGTLP